MRLSVFSVFVFILLGVVPDIGLAMSPDEMEFRKGQLEAQLKSAIESYTMAKKIYEESLRTKDSLELRRMQFFEAKDRVKRLHGELRALGIKSEYMVLDKKIQNLLKDIDGSADVPRGTSR